MFLGFRSLLPLMKLSSCPRFVGRPGKWISTTQGPVLLTLLKGTLQLRWVKKGGSPFLLAFSLSVLRFRRLSHTDLGSGFLLDEIRLGYDVGLLSRGRAHLQEFCSGQGRGELLACPRRCSWLLKTSCQLQTVAHILRSYRGTFNIRADSLTSLQLSSSSWRFLTISPKIYALNPI